MRKRKKLFIFFMIILTLTVYLLLSFVQEDVPDSSIILNILGIVNAVLILGLLLLSARGIIKQTLEGRRFSFFKVPLRTKLTALTLGLVVIPSSVILGMGTVIIYSIFNNWYNPELGEVLSGAQLMAEDFQNTIAENTAHFTRVISNEISPEILEKRGSLPLYLKSALEEKNLSSIEIYRQGTLIAFIRNENLPLKSLKPSIQIKKDDVEKGNSFHIMEDLEAGRFVRFGTLIPLGKSLRDRHVIVGGSYISKNISNQLSYILQSYNRYNQVKSTVKSLKVFNISSLLLIGIVAVFSGLWTGFKFTDLFLSNFNQLLEGTERVSRGELDFGIEVSGNDEVARLLNSFNDMVGKLRTHEQELKLRAIELESMNKFLEEKKHYFETVLSNIPIGIISINNFGNIFSINSFALSILNTRHKVEEGTRFSVILKECSGAKELEKVLNDLTNQGEHYAKKTILFQSDTGQRTTEVEVSALKDQQDLEIGYLITIEDVTELEKAQKMLAWKEAVRRIVHELKNPLTPIKLSAERIRFQAERDSKNLKNIVIESVRPMIEEINVMQSLIDNFSRFAKMAPPERTPINVNELLQDIVSLLSKSTDDIEFVTMYSEALPESRLDKTLIRSAFLNILKNAMAAIEEDHGTITVKTIYLASDRRVMIEISDTGKGMDAETKEKIFIPYFSTKPKGDGLGLAIVNSIVTAHNGHITVKDNYPKGSTFTISLPVG